MCRCAYIKVRKFQKEIVVPSIPPKNQQFFLPISALASYIGRGVDSILNPGRGLALLAVV